MLSLLFVCATMMPFVEVTGCQIACTEFCNRMQHVRRYYAFALHGESMRFMVYLLFGVGSGNTIRPRQGGCKLYLVAVTVFGKNGKTILPVWRRYYDTKNEI